jgi:hypothetical protein
MHTPAAASSLPICQRIADLTAEARRLSAERAARTPERMAAYFWTKAAVLADIAASYHALDLTDALAMTTTSRNVGEHDHA